MPILNCGETCWWWKSWGCGHPQGPRLVAAVPSGLQCVVAARGVDGRPGDSPGARVDAVDGRPGDSPGARVDEVDGDAHAE